jgi:hypothetical protein
MLSRRNRGRPVWLCIVRPRLWSRLWFNPGRRALDRLLVGGFGFCLRWPHYRWPMRFRFNRLDGWHGLLFRVAPGSGLSISVQFAVWVDGIDGVLVGAKRPQGRLKRRAKLLGTDHAARIGLSRRAVGCVPAPTGWGSLPAWHCVHRSRNRWACRSIDRERRFSGVLLLASVAARLGWGLFRAACHYRLPAGCQPTGQKQAAEA